jgi:hypothetical protein
MNRYERRALEALRLDWTQSPEDVWKTSPFHVDGLHHEVLHSIVNGIRAARDSDGASPTGVAILGQRGAGKTHLLGVVREHVQAEGGYFFLVELLDAGAFWESVAQALVGGLLRDTDGHERQLTAFLRRLGERTGVLASVQAAVLGEAPLSRRDLTSFIGALRRLNQKVGLECQDTARALVLCGSTDFEAQDIGHQYLSSMAEAEPGDRTTWGIHPQTRTPQLVVRDISRLLALTGPSVIAVDQIDPMVAVATKLPAQTDNAFEDGRDALLLDQLAAGLMSLRDISRRTLSVVACLPDSWILIKERAVSTIRDRFKETRQLHRIPSPEIGRVIVERRFGVRFREVGFEPAYPTWPVAAEAFEEAVDFTPRRLLQRVDAHVQSCLRSGEVRELTRLTTGQEPTGARPTPEQADLSALDARFAELRETAEVAAALDPATEDETVPGLLTAALTAWIAERGAASHEYAQDPPPGRKPPLHARLRRSLDEETEDELHWAFRAIASDNARAAQCRIRNACTLAGLRQDAGKRRLYLLRNGPWPSGPVTREVVTAFTEAGGAVLPLTEDDLRTFAALRQLLTEHDPHLQEWLVARRPASGSPLLRAALADAVEAAPPAAASEPAASEPTVTVTAEATPSTVAARPAAPVTAGEPWQLRAVGRAAVPTPAAPRIPAPRAGTTADEPPAITIGTAVDGRRPVQVSLESLRKHTAIFAGSGSGKTVLIRRLVEECALRGVSAIVLDPNNDLARLGDRWPEPPVQWSPEDAHKAEEYLAHTDVVIWTPRRELGRPLTFQPLPDFRGVRDDPDELGAAIDAAVAALAPRAKVDGKTTKATHGQAVLREALRYFAERDGRGDLRSFISLLSDLPAGVSALDRADRLAADLAQTLTAAMVIDPLFGGDGVPVDPGLLLTPRPGRRARVSVISLVGLPADHQRQGFVNQLQMALFAWIKRHPAGDRPLGGLLVMDEAQTFAPSGAMTACTESTLALASQARKYGLGLVFATQAPRGLHNRIPGNAATQLFGFLNSPVQIEAAREMARAKGSPVLDISRLTTGQFYASGEGFGFQKVQTPLCLTHHPKSPLTTEEVIERARATASAAEPAEAHR